MPFDIIRIRRDTLANWTSVNPTLALGEISYDLTSDQIRVGDGTSAWLDLPPIGNSAIADGDKGDIVISGSGTTWSLDSTLMATINGKLDSGPLDGGSAPTLDQQIQLRRDITTNWLGVVLNAGEIGYDSTINEIRIGDGTSIWQDLDPIGMPKLPSLSLEQLFDVEFPDTAPAQGEVLTFDETSGVWINLPIPMQSISLNDLTTVTLTAPQNTEILQFNGTQWVNAPGPVASTTLPLGSKGEITVVGQSDWQINDGVITQDNLNLVLPVNPEDAATKGYTDNIVGLAIAANVTEELDQASGIAVLDSTRKVARLRLGDGFPASTNFLRGDGNWATVTPAPSQLTQDDAEAGAALVWSEENLSWVPIVFGDGNSIAPIYNDTALTYTFNLTQGDKGDITVNGDNSWTIDSGVVTMQNLSFADHEMVHPKDNMWGHEYYHSDGTSPGSFVTSFGTGANPTRGIVTLTGTSVDLTTDANLNASVARLRHMDRAKGAPIGDYNPFGSPCALAMLQATVTYTGGGGGDTGTNAYVGFTATHNAEDQLLVAFVCTGQSTWQIRIKDEGSGSATVDSTTDSLISSTTEKTLRIEVWQDSILFYEVSPATDTADEVAIVRHTYNKTGTEAPTIEAYAGCEIRSRGTSSPSQTLSVKEMFLHIGNEYKELALVDHTHGLSDLEQGGATSDQVLRWNGSAWAASNDRLTDGDKGDITVSSSGATWTIDNLAITAGKLATNSVFNAKIVDGAVGLSKIFQLDPGTFIIGQNDGIANVAGSFDTTTMVESGTASSPIFGVKDGGISTTKLGGDITTAGKALLDDADASAQRTTLGLGTIATQAASSVAITGGSLQGVTVTTGAYSSNANEAIMHIVRKDTAGTITKGQVVRVVGSTGSHLTVELADASTGATSDTTIGVAAETITNSTSGYMMVMGELTGLSNVPTSGGAEDFVDGSPLWLSETAGLFTQTRPSAPAHGVVVGFVIDASNGSNARIFVQPNNGHQLNQIHDVSIGTQAEKDVLSWDNTAGVWKNRTLTDANIAPANATYIVQTANSELSGEQALGSLSTGILKNTTSTGVLSIAAGADIPAAGSAGQVQFNNTTGLGAASKVKIQADGHLEILKASSVPSTPSTDSVVPYVIKKADRSRPTWIDETGMTIPFQACMADKHIRLWKACTGVSQASIDYGCDFVTAGTATAASIGSSNFQACVSRLGLVTSTAASQFAGVRMNGLQAFQGDGTNANRGGYFFMHRFGMNDSVPTANSTMFVGLTSFNSTPAQVDPTNTTWANAVALIKRANDANFFLINRNGTGTAVITDTGIALSTTTMYDLYIYTKPNGSTIFVRLEDLGAGTSFETSLSSSIPTNTTTLTATGWRCNGASGVAATYLSSSMYMETNF